MSVSIMYIYKIYIIYIYIYIHIVIKTKNKTTFFTTLSFTFFLHDAQEKYDLESSTFMV